MTRSELQNELKRIDGYIEILHGLITIPLCKCISHLGNFDETFREENKIQLQHFIAIKNDLLLLRKKTDDALGKIQHQPIKY